MNFTMASENIKFDNIEGESNEITLSSEDTEIFDTSNNTQIVYVYEDQLEEELISSDIPSTSNNNKKSRSYKQYYRKEWEDIQDFKGKYLYMHKCFFFFFFLYFDRNVKR